MTIIDHMWEKFAAHQPKADRLGYGAAWRRMCEERTDEAAEVAWAAAWAAKSADALAAYAAAWAAAYAKRWAERAIECIDRAEDKP